MESNKAVRWAILGAGHIANAFAKDIVAVNNAKLVAVASRDKQRAKEFAEKYAIPNIYSYNELYASPEVDAVYIATTHNFHLEQSLQCLQNGKAVLCEKPVTINDKEFNQMAAVSAQQNVFLMEALWTYFLPAIIKAKQWVDEGKIGMLKSIQADFSHPMKYNEEGRMFNPLLAGGALLDLGIYPIAFASYFAGKPVAIKASAQFTKTGVDEKMAMIFEYREVIALLYASMVNGGINRGVIMGDAGYIEVPEFFKAPSARLYNNTNDLTDTFNDNRTTMGYNYEIQEATDCILNGQIESRRMPHSKSTELQETMTEVRKQVGFTYPMEK